MLRHCSVFPQIPVLFPRLPVPVYLPQPSAFFPDSGKAAHRKPGAARSLFPLIPCAPSQARSWTAGPGRSCGRAASDHVSPVRTSGCLVSKLSSRYPGPENWLHTPGYLGLHGACLGTPSVPGATEGTPWKGKALGNLQTCHTVTVCAGDTRPLEATARDSCGSLGSALCAWGRGKQIPARPGPQIAAAMLRGGAQGARPFVAPVRVCLRELQPRGQEPEGLGG